MHLDNRTTATVLAALRLWQRSGHRPLELEQIADNDGTVDPLDADEIDELCQRLNADGPDPGLPLDPDARVGLILKDEGVVEEGQTLHDVLSAGGALIDGCMDPPAALFKLAGDERWWVGTVEFRLGADANPKFVRDAVREQLDDHLPADAADDDDEEAGRRALWLAELAKLPAAEEDEDG